MTFTGNPGNWIGAGFAENYWYPGNGNAQFNENGVNGYDWAILSESSGNVQFFSGPSGTNQIFNRDGFFTAGPGTHTLTLTLDTTAMQWVISCHVDGVKAGPDFTYTTQPQITAVGVTQHTLTTPGAIHWNSFTLEATGMRSTNPVKATVSFSGAGVPLNPSFVGLSYEKAELTKSLFSAIVNMKSSDQSAAPKALLTPSNPPLEKEPHSVMRAPSIWFPLAAPTMLVTKLSRVGLGCCSMTCMVPPEPT